MAEEVWIKCKALKEEGGEVYVECSYIRFPWEPSWVPYKGEPFGAEVRDGKIKLGLKGKVLLKGKEGERGRLGPKEFYFQVPDVGVLGEMNGVAVVYLLGKGRYAGTIYGARVEGVSKGDEVFGVPPLRGSSAHLEVGGIWIDKELPDPKALPPADLDLPYKVLAAGRRLKVELGDAFEVVSGEKQFAAKGVVELPYGSVLIYKGIPERPMRVEVEKVFEVWTGEVKKAYKVPGGLVLHTQRTTLLVKEGVKDLGFQASCYFSDNLYAVGSKAYIKGKTVELPAVPFSCASAGKYAVFSIPSKPIYITLRLFSPTVAISIPPTEVPWEIPWSDLKNAHLVLYDIEKEKLYKVEMLPGAYGLYLGRHLLAYNLFGELRVYDKDLKLLWRREANGIRDVEERDYLAIWTYRPPRIRVYEEFYKQVLKVSTNNKHVGLCADEKALYAVDGNKLRLFLPKAYFYELRARVEEGLACYSFGNAVAIAGKEKLSVWRPKVEISP